MKTFDANVLKANQISIVGLIMLAWLLQFSPLVAVVGLVMLLGTLEPRLALFKQFYLHIFRPTFKIQVLLEQDDPRPHNFAQGLGSVFLGLSSLFFVLGSPNLGWIVAFLVLALALLNLTTKICVGCFLYFQWRQLSYRLKPKSF